MAQPYVGEIRMFAGNFAPAGWHFCDGALLPISEFETLFQLIGTTYGGDGQTNFAVPDLRGRLPIHQTSGFSMGQAGGVESVTLSLQQIPAHSHPVIASGDSGTASSAQNSLTAQSVSVSVYRAAAPNVNFNSQAIGFAGGSQPHSNIQPFLCVSFIISQFGIFPSQT